MESSLDPISHLFKLIVIGDGNAGKTSIIHRYCQDIFNANTRQTIGVEFHTKHIDIDDAYIRLQIWDTAGQERFRGLGSSYYKGACGVLIVYDTTSFESFQSCKTWIKEIEQYCSENVQLMVLGNKKDLIEERKILMEDGKHLAKTLGALFYETSAKDNGQKEIQQAFKTFCKNIQKHGEKPRLDAKHQSNIIKSDYSSTRSSQNIKLSSQDKKDAKEKKDDCAC